MELTINDLHLPITASDARPIEGGYLLKGQQITVQHPFGSTKFYRHGFHSWSLTAWLDLSKPLLTPTVKAMWPHIDDMTMLEDYPFTSSGVAALQGPDGNILLLGALGLDAHVKANSSEITGNAASAIDWFLAHGPEQTVFARDAELLGERLGRRAQKPAPRVWCSWYGLYGNISAEIIQHTLHGVRSLPFDVFQVDDGWQIAIGDWDANTRFPDGTASLALDISEAGFTPGIWYAPFIVRPESQLFQDHPDWLLRDDQGQLVPAGQNWGGTFYALDTTHPAVLDWLRHLAHRLRGRGFYYQKIDFLYAAALPGKRYQELPPEQAYRLGLEAVRQGAGDDVYLLVCGSPVLASLGLADGMRVGPDVAPIWDNPDRSIHLHDLTGPSALNALRTSLNRLWLHPLVHVDPDVVYFRTRYNLLKPRERALIQDLALIADFRATSDLPEWLDPDERAALQNFLETQPAIERINHYKFCIDGREVDYGFVEGLN